MLKLDIPTRKAKKTYQKPERKVVDPQTAIAMLRPLALAGDKCAQELIQAITDRRGMARDHGQRSSH